MADANIRINVETSSLEQLNAELSALQAQIAKVPVGSAEFKKLSAEIRRVDGAVEGANRKLKSLDVGAIAGDVAKLGGAVASASALFKQFGSEGSSSQEAVQKALETTNTILGAGAIAEGVASAARLAGVAATKAATIAQSAYTAVVGTSTGALKAFRIALASTGIGLIVVALGALVANWDKLTAAIGGSTKSAKEFKEESEKIIAQLDREASRLDNNIERQRALGESEQELLRQRVEGNKKAEEELKELSRQSGERIREANAAVRKENSENNRKKLEEEKEIGKQLVFEAEKIEKEREQLRREGLNLRLKSLDFEREKAVLAAKKNGQDVLAVEKQFAQRKLEQLKNSYVASKEEIERQEFEISKIEEEARQERDRKRKEDAEKRRATLKSEIEAVINIIKESDRDIQLAILDAEQKTITQGLDNITKKTKTLAQVIAELRKEGQGPYADFINNLFKSGKTIEQIGKIIEESFGKKTQDILNEFTTQGINKLTESFDQLVKDLAGYEEDVKKFGVGFGQSFSEGFLNIVKDTEGNILSAASSLVLSSIPSIKELADSLQSYGDQIDDFFAKERDKLEELRKNNKITEAEFKTAGKNLTKLNQETLGKFKDFREKTVKSFVDLSNEILTTNITKVQAAAQDQITKLEIKLYQDSANKTAKVRAKLEEDFQNQKKEIIKKEIQDEIELLNKQEKDIENLRDTSVISVQEAANKIEEIERKKTALQRDLAKQATEAIVTEEQKRVEAAQEFLQVLEKVKEAYALISGSIQAIGNLLADQAALQDLRFSEEIERVQELYDERFRLIDEEGKKLDDLEQAKDNKISATERKRRALAKERAGLEAQQAEELAQLEADRANAAADAAIKQAEVNFALAVGQIVISTAEAVAKSIAQSPQTFGLPFSAFAVAQGALQLAAANSARQVAIAQAEASRPGVSGAKNVRVSKAEGGLITGPGNAVSDSVPANLSNGEFVVNANATRQFLPLLNQINQSGLQGGNPVNASGFSDPAMLALLERIDQKLAQPNRSYVVYNDIENIQNKQNYINRRSNVL